MFSGSHLQGQLNCGTSVDGIQLFRQRLSKKSAKAYVTMLKGSLRNTH